MAIYHCSVSLIQRSVGHSSTAAAAYRAAIKLKDERTGTTHDYSKRRGVFATEIIAPDGAPGWMQNRATLWNGVEAVERRKDAQVARHLSLALPAELTHQQKVDLTHAYVREQFVTKGMVADVAYHDFGTHNPHAHMLLTLRTIDGDGFGKKNRDWNKKALLEEWRMHWANHANQALKQAGIDARIDHRTLAAQGIARLPQIHLGKATLRMAQREILTERYETFTAIQAMNDNQSTWQRDLAELERRIAQLQNEEVLAAANDNRTAKRNANHQKDVRPLPTTPHASSSDVMVKRTSSCQGSDLTYRAVSRQLKAMGAARYDIGILQPPNKDGDRKMHRRYWTAEQLLSPDKETGKTTKLDWLKAQNRKGADIYIRPDPREGQNHGLILVDDLSQGQLTKLTQDGFKPAVITETSDMNYQAWIRLSNAPLPAHTATEAGRLLAKRYDGDPGSIDWMHYGRLAGFTNRKGEHTRKDGKQPFVKLDSYYGKPADQAHQLLTAAKAQLKVRQQRLTPPSALPDNTPAPAEEKAAALAWFSENRHVYRAEFGEDESRIDWHQTKALLKQGYSPASVQYALTHASPDLEGRKHGHVDDYVTRTVTNALNRADVQKARRTRSRAEKGHVEPRHDAPGENPSPGIHESVDNGVDEKALIQQWQQQHDRERPSAPVQPHQAGLQGRFEVVTPEHRSRLSYQENLAANDNLPTPPTPPHNGGDGLEQQDMYSPLIKSLLKTSDKLVKGTSRVKGSDAARLVRATSPRAELSPVVRQAIAEKLSAVRLGDPPKYLGKDTGREFDKFIVREYLKPDGKVNFTTKELRAAMNQRAAKELLSAGHKPKDVAQAIADRSINTSATTPETRSEYGKRVVNTILNNPEAKKEIEAIRLLRNKNDLLKDNRIQSIDIAQRRQILEDQGLSKLDKQLGTFQKNYSERIKDDILKTTESPFRRNVELAKSHLDASNANINEVADLVAQKSPEAANYLLPSQQQQFGRQIAAQAAKEGGGPRLPRENANYIVHESHYHAHMHMQTMGPQMER